MHRDTFLLQTTHFITQLLAAIYYDIVQNMVWFWCSHPDSVHEVGKYKNGIYMQRKQPVEVITRCFSWSSCWSRGMFRKLSESQDRSLFCCCCFCPCSFRWRQVCTASNIYNTHVDNKNEKNWSQKTYTASVYLDLRINYLVCNTNTPWASAAEFSRVFKSRFAGRK